MTIQKRIEVLEKQVDESIEYHPIQLRLDGLYHMNGKTYTLDEINDIVSKRNGATFIWDMPSKPEDYWNDPNIPRAYPPEEVKNVNNQKPN